ncbi:VWA domain-containing protein [Rhizobium sp. B230/85]|uniref:vWA domain-containing protein n=2 Tax=Rhizobium TaxID=379 RepID=UPI001ADC4F67|nr:TadE/TadG family type IV pilus assembly protein [Rhizobium sp. B230/85]MBO9099756.1 VWA domain-containing protein [Rhizobium sp. L58/93]MBO9131701.1 VWA domain-containing protein [Rhizobium sp. B209b/85]MBO9169745.1 VWA domain-containing protein [Rhizobium sp. L245/93]MBO9185703.1 VWA domain-containing protein [Rhizobium sp. E27B/91]QXZ82467.1 VWA domain-containing protein [Rhizobium sp. K1/93]QXZ90021.1 VWA domain-containing protein [Rhizobium sp. K15/93]QYA02557.1 VWA domain-containing 
MMSTSFRSGFGLRRFFSDRSGNFGILTALAVPVVFAGAGVAVDVSNMVLSKNQLQNATDAAALATASALADGTTTTTNAQAFGKDFVSGQMANYLGSDATTLAALKSGTKVNVTPTTDATTGSKSYAVSINGSFPQQVNGMTKLLGWNQVTIATSSSTSSNSATAATSTGQALSMFLALDKSGSMAWVTSTKDTSQLACWNYTESSWPYAYYTAPCYVSKIAALKQAAGVLFDQLDKSDPTKVLVRLGGLTYTDTTDTGKPEPQTWGSSSMRSYVNRIDDVPTGGTDASGPMAQAYSALTANAEASAQLLKGNKTFAKYIVLMTDGENTGHSSVWNPSLDTATLNSCKSARDAGITIYTVAFMAPTNGQNMLKSCAGNISNYYQANDMISLVAAFKSIGQKAADQTVRMTQ